MPESLVQKLRQRHPWYDLQASTEWPDLRAVLSRVRDEKEKKRLLIKGEFEKEEHYKVRVAMSRFVGVTQTAIDRFAGALVEEPPAVDFGGNADLEEWAKSVDGMRTSIEYFVEGLIPESAGMGLIGVFVDRPRASAEAMAAAGLTEADMQSSQAPQRRLGVFFPRLVTVPAEQIINWETDAAGKPLWVVLERAVPVQKGPLEGRELFIEWIVIDRQTVRIWRAKPKAGYECQPGQDGLPVFKSTTEVEGEPQEISPPGGFVHNLGRVPFAVLPGRELGPFMGASLFDGTAQTDLAYFCEESHGAFGRYIHNVPFLVLKLGKNRKVADVVRETGGAMKLDADPEVEESAEYVSTPSESFETHEQVLERHRMEGYRQANSDPSGLFNGKASAESGRKSLFRHVMTEGRTLRSMAHNLSIFGTELLELAALRMGATEFKGSMRYATQFDLSTAEELIRDYTDVGDSIESETWHRHMLRRIARRTSGDVSPEDRKKIDDEISKQTIRPLTRGAPEAQVGSDGDVTTNQLSGDRAAANS